MRISRRKLFLLCLCVVGFSLLAPIVSPQDIGPIPKITIGLERAQSRDDVSLTFQILFLLTILTLAPAILVMTTAFTRIVIVLSFVRTALGLQQIPPNQVLIGLALFLTFFVMAPVLDKVNTDAVAPYMEGKLDFKGALDTGQKPLREFMFKETREKDLALFIALSKGQRPRTRADVPTLTLIPAFVTSELKTAFWMGFKIYVPFLVLDMMVASILMSMGMLMLPPMMISLPAKVLLFVMVDGWHQLVRGIAMSFR
jgi:flagellar biosynthetic protein FliP